MYGANIVFGFIHWFTSVITMHVNNICYQICLSTGMPINCSKSDQKTAVSDGLCVGSGAL